MNSTRYTENRRGYLDSDYDSLPKRMIFKTFEEIEELMSSNQIAYEIRKNKYRSNYPFGLSILARYYRVVREKTSKMWKIEAECFASCCASAQDQLKAEIYGKLVRVISERDWLKLKQNN